MGHITQTFATGLNDPICNTIRIFDDHGLLLVKFDLVDLITSITTYEYKNIKTGQEVSGPVYFSEVYLDTYSVNFPSENQTGINIEKLIQETSDNNEVDIFVDYYHDPESRLFEFDEKVNTDPSKIVYSSNQPLHISTKSATQIETLLSSLVEFQTGGSLTLDQIREDPENLIHSTSAIDYITNEIVSKIIVKDAPPLF